MTSYSKIVEAIPGGVCGGIQVRGSDGLMMGRGVIFGKVVGTIGLSFAPIDFELTLTNAIPDPINTHVIGNAAGGIVVGGHWGCRLRMPHFFECNA